MGIGTSDDYASTWGGDRVAALRRRLAESMPDAEFNVLDFTFDAYDRLLDTGQTAGYDFLTVDDYLRRSNPPEQVIVIRHDVDRRPGNAAEMARVERDRGVSTTYYVREHLFDPEFVRTLQEYGHEVGYHYENLAEVDGDHAAATAQFERNLERFRAHVDVSTVSAHGSPLSPHNNRSIWENGASLDGCDLRGDAALSIDHDPSDDADLRYFSETGRRWGTWVPGYGRVATTDDVLTVVEEQLCDRLYFLVHPSRWARTRTELAGRVAWDLGAESVKNLVRFVHSD